MATYIWINIGSNIDLLPDVTKPLPEPMLTNDQGVPLAVSWGQFHSLQSVWKLHIWKYCYISEGPVSVMPMNYAAVESVLAWLGFVQ